MPHAGPVRVALVTTYYHPVVGGVETTARQLASGLQGEGLRVQVLTRRTPSQAPVTESIDGIPVTRLGPAGERTGSGKWRLVPGLLKALLQRRHEYDIILCIDFRGIGLAAVTAGRLLGKPVVLQAETPDALSGAHQDAALGRRGLSPEGRVGRVIKALPRTFYNRADAHVCISREIEAEVRSCGVEEDRIRYIPHGVDVERFRPASAASQRGLRAQLPGQLIVMYVGRLSREKGILDLLGAWSQIHLAHTTLVVVGPDMPGHPLDVGAEVRRRVEEPQLRGRVVLHGPADPAPLLAAADVMVQPSHYEAFGQSALEAVASGLPVVASRTGGLPDFLHHGENALLFEPQDVQGLADALRAMLTNDEMRRRFGSRGRQIAEEHFALPVVVRQYADLCRQLTGARA